MTDLRHFMNKQSNVKYPSQKKIRCIAIDAVALMLDQKQGFIYYSF